MLARLYVPRNEPRWLLRNALVALGNTGGPDAETRRVLRRHAAGEDALLAEHATLGAREGGGAMPLRGTERWISFVRLVVLPLVLILVLSANFPDGAWGPWAGVTSAVFTVGSVVSSSSHARTSASGGPWRRA